MARQGVILAAGQGVRMGALGERYPKCLLPVGNQPLIVHQLDLMRRLGMEEVTVVIGHLGEAIRARLGDGTDYGVPLKFVEQRQREGIAAAIGLLRDNLPEPFLVLLGDSYYECKHLDHFAARMASDTAAILSVKVERDPAEIAKSFSVEQDPANRVIRVVEKPTAPRSSLNGCGIYWFTPAIFEAIDNTPRSALRNEYEITDAIQTLIDTGAPVYAAEVIETYVNMTVPEDLITCNRQWLHRQKRSAYTGEACKIAAGTELIDTVAGDRVTIESPARYERCVILPGTVRNDGLDLRDQVLF